MSTGKLIIVSGFSGVGKGTAISGLMERNPGKYNFSISATTRNPRPGEQNGREYYFISHEEFEKMISEDKLLEYTKYGVNYYGTPLEPIDKMLAEGKNIILDIEVTGMLNVKKARRDALTVFIVPPTSDVLVERLIGRGTESEEDTKRRLNQAVEESAFAPEYDAVIANIDINDTVDQLESFIKNGYQPEEEKERNLILSSKVCEGLKRYINEGDF